MPYIVSITSQGQISIPAKLRKELRLQTHKKAMVSKKGDNILIEPVADLLDLKGSLQTKIKTSPSAIRRAFENYLAKEAVRSK